MDNIYKKPIFDEKTKPFEVFSYSNITDIEVWTGTARGLSYHLNVGYNLPETAGIQVLYSLHVILHSAFI